MERMTAVAALPHRLDKRDEGGSKDDLDALSEPSGIVLPGPNSHTMQARRALVCNGSTAYSGLMINM
jgi:hypothetical protein